MRFDYRQIRKARKLAGWSQEELAKRSGVAQTLISQVERGVNQSAKTFKKLAEALDLDLNELLVDDSTNAKVMKLAKQISELVGTRE